MSVGAPEIIVILLVALIVLGPSKLPEAARSVGKGMREMKDALQGNDLDDDPYADDEHHEVEGPTAKPVP